MPELGSGERGEEGELTDATRESGGSAHEKDSGISRTTDSEPELLPPPICSPGASSPVDSQGGSSNASHSPPPGFLQPTKDSSATITTPGTPSTEATFGSKSLVNQDRNGGTYSAASSPGSEAAPPLFPRRMARSDSDGSLEKELASLHREMENVKIECDRLIAQHTTAEQKILQQMRTASNLMATVDSMAGGGHGNFPKESPNALMKQVLGRIRPYAGSPSPTRRAQSRNGAQHGSNPAGHEFATMQPFSPSKISTASPSLRKKAAFLAHQNYSANQTTYRMQGDQMIPPPPSHGQGPLCDDTSSAYNTGGDSARSTPMNFAEPHHQMLADPPASPALAKFLMAAQVGVNTEPGSPIRSASRDRDQLKELKLRRQRSELRTPNEQQNGSQKQFLRTQSTGTGHPMSTPQGFAYPYGVDPNGTPVNMNPYLVAGDSQSKITQDMIALCQQFRTCATVYEDEQGPLPIGDVMYTSPENLQETIQLQQRILREAMIRQAHNLRQQQQIRSPDGSHSMGRPSSSRQYQAPPQSVEWKVKRRSDGSRYVTKRPVRNKLLRERAQQLTSERCGITTDDDTFSELKVGRYWTREEKKKHMERARERKRRAEDILRRKAEPQQPASILQLSHKKMMRRKGHQLFDQFTTVQEYLAHGNRTAENSKALGILSVTTV